MIILIFCIEINYQKNLIPPLTEKNFIIKDFNWNLKV